MTWLEQAGHCPMEVVTLSRVEGPVNRELVISPWQRLVGLWELGQQWMGPICVVEPVSGCPQLALALWRPCWQRGFWRQRQGAVMPNLIAA